MPKICDETYYVQIEGTYLDNFGSFQSGGALGKIVNAPNLALTTDGIAGMGSNGELAYWYKIGTQRFKEAGWRLNSVSITIYSLQTRTNCRCSDDSFTIECPNIQDNFCCITKQIIFDLCTRLKNG